MGLGWFRRPRTVAASVAEHELRAAFDAATGGEFEHVDVLASHLLAVSHGADLELIGLAEQLLAEAGARFWLGLDSAARRSYWNPAPWSSASAQSVQDRDPRPVELLMAACNASGYVRAAAVARLAELAHPGRYPVLALRAADWVSQVRDLARATCQRHLDLAPARTFAALAPVAFTLRRRRVGGWLAAELERRMQVGSPEILAAGMQAEDRYTRRTAYTIGLAANRIPADRLLRAALGDQDNVIRLRCAEVAIRNSSGTEVAQRLLASRIAGVRAEAISTLASLGDLEPANRGLTERSTLVRNTAQAMLRRANHDPAQRYRGLVTAQPVAPEAIAGLGETGSAADVAVLRGLLHHQGRARAETVGALRRLGDAPLELLRPLLTDPSPSVTRQVARSLLQHASLLDERALRDLLAPNHPQHVRIAALRLLSVRDAWTRIAVALQVVDDPVFLISQRGMGELQSWLGRDAATTYAMPSQSRATELSVLITEAEPTIGPDVARQLRFHAGLTRAHDSPVQQL